MKKSYFFILIFYCFLLKANAQNSSCTDSSYRLVYNFNNNSSSLVMYNDTSGYNLFSGSVLSTIPYPVYDIIPIFKTTWGDSVIWARKILIKAGVSNIIPMPNGDFLLYGLNTQINSTTLYVPFLCRINSDGRVIWAKYFSSNTPLSVFSGANFYLNRNISIANNAIYGNFNFRFGFPDQTTESIIFKLDLNGNIIWSKSFVTNPPLQSSSTDAPIYNNGKLYFATTWAQYTPFEKYYTALTELNDVDGTVVNSNHYKLSNDSFGLNTATLSINVKKNLVFNGFLTYHYPPNSTSFSTNFFIVENKNSTTAKIYLSDINFNFFGAYTNNNKLYQLAYLEKFLSGGEKYIVSVDSNYNISRSRKFLFLSNTSGGTSNSINIDDKNNIHLLQSFRQNNILNNEYCRIGNFAPNSTLSCVGKDTALFTQRQLPFTKTPFTWDIINNNTLVSQDVPYLEDTAIVNKQLICKIVSYCDSVKISGTKSPCINKPVRYTVKRNIGCQKFNDWAIDTAFTNSVVIEGDSAITISFKKHFNGYLYASLNDCVVKDSFLITTAMPKMPPLINRKDSLLCPGKTLTLTANNGYSQYQWQGGTANNQQLMVSNAGLYRITALDSCNVPIKDSIRVTLIDTSLTIIGSQTICLKDTAYITLAPDVKNILWQPQGNSLLRNNTIVAYPLQTTLYNITAERQPNCEMVRNSLVIVKNCPTTVFIPNSFTPNGDGLNDKFKPTISQQLASYKFVIYNRYSQVIFETTQQNKGWDGNYKNSKQPIGGYIYNCTYQFKGGIVQNERGYFLLIR